MNEKAITKSFQQTKHVTDFKVYVIHFVLFILNWNTVFERRGSVMVSTSALHAIVTPGPGNLHQVKNLAFNVVDCSSFVTRMSVVSR